MAAVGLDSYYRNTLTYAHEMQALVTQSSLMIDEHFIVELTDIGSG